jgi:MerR family transcriptional regulator/heat shock protein HspR
MSVDFGSERALYTISVVSDLTGVHPQTLRTYEAKGLLEPHRTDGGTRRYSGNDVERIRRITELLSSGLNLEGVQQVLKLQAEASDLRDEIAELRSSQPS